MPFVERTAKNLLGAKAPRRCLSVAGLAGADAVALLIGLVGAGRVFGARIGALLDLAPLLVAAWIVVFAAFRLYDKAPIRRNPGALIGGALVWAGLVTVGAYVYPGTMTPGSTASLPPRSSGSCAPALSGSSTSAASAGSTATDSAGRPS